MSYFFLCLKILPSLNKNLRLASRKSWIRSLCWILKRSLLAWFSVVQERILKVQKQVSVLLELPYHLTWLIITGIHCSPALRFTSLLSLDLQLMANGRQLKRLVLSCLLDRWLLSSPTCPERSLTCISIRITWISFLRWTMWLRPASTCLTLTFSLPVGWSVFSGWAVF